jgi:hypothetical protein
MTIHKWSEIEEKISPERKAKVAARVEAELARIHALEKAKADAAKVTVRPLSTYTFTLTPESASVLENYAHITHQTPGEAAAELLQREIAYA